MKPLLTLAVLVLAAAPVAQAQSFNVLPLPTSRGLALSPDGKTIAGRTGNQGFIWTEEEGVTLIGPSGGGGTSELRAVANDGFAAGSGSFDVSGALRWSPEGGITMIPEGVGARGISADGSVVVGYGLPAANPRTAFRWTESGGFAYLPPLPGSSGETEATGISASGAVIVGRGSASGSNRRAVRWTSSGVTQLGNEPLGPATQVAISPDGSAIATTVNRTDHAEAALWNGQSWAGLGRVPGFPSSFALAVSDGGTVVGGHHFDDGGVQHASLWTEAGGMRLVEDVLTQDYGLDLMGVELAQVNGVSADGTVISGWGTIYLQGGGFRVVTWWAEIPPISRRLVVNSTADRFNLPGRLFCNTGQTVLDDDAEVPECTLRAAIQVANARGAADSVSFRIPGEGPHVIAPNNMIPIPAVPLVIDATTQPGYAGVPLVVLNGGGGIANGLMLGAGASAVRGFAIGGFTGAGVRLVGAGQNVVEANYLGVLPDGVTPLPNGVGVWVEGSPDNRIGGAERGNVVSGNLGAGVRVIQASGTRIEGNRVGLSASGTAAVGNGGAGVLVEGAYDTRIGYGPGATGSAGQGPGNVVSGNAEHGIRIVGSMPAPADGSVVAGNLVGLDAAGAQALANGDTGIEVRGAASGAHVRGNVIVNEASRGGVVLIDLGPDGGAPDGIRVTGNSVGLNASGSSVLGTTGVGVLVTSAASEEGGVEGVRVGEEEAGNRLVAIIGVWLEGQRSAGTTVTANTIGLLGSGALATDGAIGVYATLADSVQVRGNVVGGQAVGVLLAGDRHGVYDNRIGTDPGGTSARPNGIGIEIPESFVLQGTGFPVGNGVRIGAPGEGNLVSGNTQSGVVIGGTFSDPFGRVAGTPGGASALDPAALPALRDRLAARVARVTHRARSGGDRARFGAERVEERRAGNDLAGDGRATGIVVSHNRIGTTASGTGALGNGTSDDVDEAGSGLMLRGTLGTVVFANTLSGNGVGLAILNQDLSTSQGPEGALVAGNRIGVAAVSDAALPNQYLGVLIYGSNGNALLSAPLDGGGVAEGNVVRSNGGSGVRVIYEEGLGAGNTVRQTTILDNEGAGIEVVNFDTPGVLPPGVPEPPALLIAILGGTDLLLRVRPSVASELDLFVSDDCGVFAADGQDEPVPMGQGVFGVSTDVIEGDLGLLVPLVDLPGAAAGRFVSATATTPGEGGATGPFSACVRIAEADDAVILELPELVSGPVEGTGDVGIDLDIEGIDEDTALGGQGGRLYVARHRVAPHRSTFSGEAVSDDGTTVQPDVVASAHYWAVTAEDLPSITYTACVALEGVTGVEVPGQLVLVHREHAGRPWVPADSWLAGDESRLCAGGLTAFGELGIGGDESVNPVPTEPGSDEVPSALEATVYPNPVATTATLALALPMEASVRVAVYDVLGRLVSVYDPGERARGRHALRLDLAAVPSGVYLVRVEAGGQHLTRRVTVVR